MAKNFVKKSLAVGSVAAMSIFGLVAPADAAVTKFTSAPIVGTSYKAILGSAFVLRTTVSGAGAGAGKLQGISGKGWRLGDVDLRWHFWLKVSKNSFNVFLNRALDRFGTCRWDHTNIRIGSNMHFPPSN